MAATILTSTRTGTDEPTGVNSGSWITRSSLAWVSLPRVPISSKKIVPWSADSKKPSVCNDFAFELDTRMIRLGVAELEVQHDAHSFSVCDLFEGWNEDRTL